MDAETCFSTSEVVNQVYNRSVGFVCILVSIYGKPEVGNSTAFNGSWSKKPPGGLLIVLLAHHYVSVPSLGKANNFFCSSLVLSAFFHIRLLFWSMAGTEECEEIECSILLQHFWIFCINEGSSRLVEDESACFVPCLS